MTSLTLLELPKDLWIVNVGDYFNSGDLLIFRQVNKLCQAYADAIMQRIRMILIKKFPVGVVNVPAFLAQLASDIPPILSFKSLADRFFAAGVKINAFPIILTDLERLQDRAQVEQDRALCLIWQKLNQQHPTFPQLRSAREIRSWLVKDDNARLINSIRTLDLSRLNLQVLPPEISHFTALQWMDLSYNELKSLPEEFGLLSNLCMLSLANNKLRELPSSFGSLTKLIRLELGNNRLEVLPETFKALVSLMRLNLSYNRFKILPDSIPQLVNMQFLNLSNNQLSTRQNAFSAMTNIESIDHSQNVCSWSVNITTL